jgi:hypothetical protein
VTKKAEQNASQGPHVAIDGVSSVEVELPGFSNLPNLDWTFNEKWDMLDNEGKKQWPIFISSPWSKSKA